MIVAAVAALAIGGGTAAAFASHGTDDRRPATTSAVSSDRAVQLAQQRVPNSRLVEVELEHANVWEVDLVRGNVGYEVDVDATTASSVRWKSTTTGMATTISLGCEPRMQRGRRRPAPAAPLGRRGWGSRFAAQSEVLPQRF
ncbi:PepSY domain-containing protein [Fodinicola acaciae]|uniref:PepSY domain-containing protein n=1 Tax=Fodinicola acaciae TaxID=2681555 RepID=UPI0013D61520|nr:PepSY domain-containing protein [Fodinicola acaciae]